MTHPTTRPVSALLATFSIALLLHPDAALAQAEKKGAKAKLPAASESLLPSETPEKFVPATKSWDHERRDVMIPMRDGVRLHTVILVPKGAKGAPILLTRTPYDAKTLTSHAQSAHLGPAIQGYDNATDVIVDGGYIRVVQDVRGKYGSEGDYVMNRPFRGPLNPTKVSNHATDTYDTINWLVKNLPESNGRVGILGISYDGFLTLAALVNPHPALKVAVPMNPMVDGWRGDDWFHNGAFPPAGDPLLPRPGGDARQRDHLVDRPPRRLRRLPQGRLGWRDGAVARPRAGRRLAEGPRAPHVRRVLAGTGRRPGPRRPAPRGADDARPLPLGPGGHLRGDRRLGGAEAEGHGGRQALPRLRPLAPRPGDRRRELARAAEVRERHGAHVPQGDPAALPRPVPPAKGRPGPTCPRSPRSRPGRTAGGASPPGPRAARAAAT